MQGAAEALKNDIWNKLGAQF
jgi:Ca2+-binding EF-hand superfamily protein